MTYRNKLLLKRILIILAIIAAVILVLLLIGFTYLGRYVVYTENGAHFSFHSQPPETAPESGLTTMPSSIELVTGEPISATEVIGNDGILLKDTEVKGVLVDYATLENGRTLNKIELDADANNTLILELRTADHDLLTTQPVMDLISRAKTQETWLVAMISCLSDSDYALEHPKQSVQIYGGALWMSKYGSYWLDPGQDATISYLADMIKQLAELGFNEVILNDFSLPVSDRIDYDFGGLTSTEIMVNAYNDLLDATMDYCKLGLLISDPDEGHQALDAADRIYVQYDDGSAVKQYAESHPDQYLVFITGSHDTRFDTYGKIDSDGDFIIGDSPDEENPPEDDTAE